jgi:uncharacterized protein (DUF1501 family)
MGGVKGGKVYGNWPEVENQQLNHDRDPALTTDFRLVLSEILAKHVAVPNLNPIFPGFNAHPRKFLGLLRT